ncbi:MAG: TetR/AcrR family transcriptional regulator [Thermoleophilaceae bacterium]|nr:TetR/AcrR family transcriptional regulator [Thermoleophilaceae bacterium]
MAVLSKRANEPTEQRREAEQSFVRAVEELLADGASYAELSVEQISRRAGRTRTAFYFYFRDKRELLMRATEDASVDLYRAADQWFSGTSGPDEMAEALAGVFEIYREHAALLSAVVEASTYDDQVRELWRSVIQRFVDATVRRLLDEGASTGAEAARAKAFALVWMTERACYQQLAQGRPLSDDSLIAALVEIWQRGVYPGA